MSVTVENSAKAVVIDRVRILLLKNRDVAGLGEWFSLPGGRQMPEEDLRSALVREVFEETGLGVEVGSLMFVREYIHKNHELREFGPPMHKVELMFRCSLSGAQDFGDRLADEEQEEWLWVDVKDLPDLNVIPRRVRFLKHLMEGDRGDIYWGDILFEER